MGIVKRQSIFSSIATYTGVILGYLNIVILFPIVLSPEQFGLTRILVGIAIIASQAGQIGIPNITLRFFPYFRDNSNAHHGFMKFIILGSGLGCFLVTVVVLVFRNKIIGFYGEGDTLFQDNYVLIVPITLFMVFTESLGAYARSLLRIVFFSFIKEVAIRLLHFLIIILFIYDVIDFKQFLWLFVVNYGLQCLLMVIYLIVLGEMKHLRGRINISFNRLKEMAGYGMYMLAHRVPSIILSQIDILMIGAILGLAESGIYTVAFFIASIIQVPTRNISQISVPLIADAWKENNLEKISLIYHKTSLNQLIIGCFLFIIILVNFHNITHFLQPEYQDIFYVILFIGLGKLIDMSAGINGGIIITSRYFKMDLFTNILLVVLVFITNLIFIPIYKLAGAALATTLSLLIYNLIGFVFVKLKLGMQPFTIHALKGLLIATIVFIVGWNLPYFGNVFLDLFARSFLVVVLFASGILFFRVSEDINSTVTKVMKRFFN